MRKVLLILLFPLCAFAQKSYHRIPVTDSIFVIDFQIRDCDTCAWYFQDVRIINTELPIYEYECYNCYIQVNKARGTFQIKQRDSVSGLMSTRLKDINGNLIIEHDILYDRNGNRHKVYFKNGAFRYGKTSRANPLDSILYGKVIYKDSLFKKL